MKKEGCVPILCGREGTHTPSSGASPVGELRGVLGKVKILKYLDTVNTEEEPTAPAPRRSLPWENSDRTAASAPLSHSWDVCRRGSSGSAVPSPFPDRQTVLGGCAAPITFLSAAPGLVRFLEHSCINHCPESSTRPFKNVTLH